MDDLQSYVFDNSEEFSNKHYLNLMALILKAHNQITVCNTPLISEVRVNYNQEDGMERPPNRDPRTITISQEQSDGIFNIIGWGRTSIMDTMSSFIGFEHWNDQNWIKTTFIFPVTVSSIQRQSIHKLFNIGNSSSFSITNRENLRQLTIIF